MPKMSRNVAIEHNVEFINPPHITLENGVFIERNCYLDAAKGTIVIQHHVTLKDNIRITCHESTGTITLEPNVIVDRGFDIKAHGGQIQISSKVYLGPYVCIAGPGNIVIGEHCMIASHSGIYGNNHIFSDVDRPISVQGTTNRGIVLEDDCWLGTGVKVLDGVRIGRGSVIGAGAVVTQDIPPFSIAVGVPAKVIGQRAQVAEESVQQILV
jgi:acetyltransferase-like isoleucine patch superfamily enzyme